MDDLLGLVAAALVALRARVSGRAVAVLSPGELIAVNDAFGALRRAVDAAYAPVAGEIARQSRPELGKDSLAKRHGHRTAAKLISATTGASVPDAIKLVTVGEATAPGMSLTGEMLPARRPHVADALATGRLSVAAGAEITRMLDRVPPRVDPAAVAAMEQGLVGAAPGLTSDELRALLIRAEATLDPDGVEQKERELRDARYLIVREDRAGAILVDGRFDPETGAPIKAALDDIVSGMLRRRDDTHRRQGSDDPGDDPADEALADPRNVKQLYADALAELCRHALACDQAPTGPSTTVIVRINLDHLETGAGAGTIDGITRPVSAGTVRRMAADAQVIPVVLGGDSEILDWGRAKRLFTPAQKLATLERDGGCACCGLPPSMTVVHHLRWWARDRGRTDLANAIALCIACHHRIHDDGWDIHIDGNGTRAKVWFIPPPWLDPDRSPRLGGNARYNLAA